MLTTEVSLLRDMAKDHADLRQQELADKIEAATARGKKTQIQILSAIKKHEMHQDTYRILRTMRHRMSKPLQMDRLEVPESWPPPETPLDHMITLEDPKDCTRWRIVTSSSEVEYYLMIRNRLHFGQAEGTPFTCEPLKSDLDWSATTSSATNILQGQYVFRGEVPNCDDLLRECRQVEGSTMDLAEISEDEFKGKLRKWRESTTTSPSGRHLGWYKSLLASGRSTEDEADQLHTPSLRDKQETIFFLILSVMNYCIRNAYVLNRWKTVVNVMLFKDPGNYKIHRLRVIHIYEADFNLILAVKWRRALRQAVKAGSLNPGQYGGRPGCEAQSLTLLEELKYDLAYLSRRTLFHFDNDATSCYDRIVVPLASIINRKYGVPSSVVTVHARTLQAAKYYLKTATGISDHYYSNSETYPIHGTGQGSGNSPCIWLFISSTLFDIHNKVSHGAKFISPDGKERVQMSMVGFVDDSTGTFNDFQPQHEAPIQELCQRMQQDAQLWNNLLHCTGGKLELTKCSFHVLTFDFKPNGRPIPSIASFENQIHLQDPSTGDEVPIMSKKVFEVHKTLGHYKSPSVHHKTGINALRERADQIALLISMSPVTRQGAILAYHTVFVPSIRYVLPQSFFGEKELQQAQASSLNRMVSKCGYNRHTARQILFAPTNLGGAGFLPWYLMQGEGQILNFLKHWRTSTIVSKTLRMAARWAQWQSGHHRFILEDVKSPMEFLECRWITSLRNFLRKTDSSIRVSDTIVVPKERSNDIYIMPFAQSSGNFTTKELAIINYCRLYLHATTVSELFDSSGKNILPELFQCRREPWFNPSTVITLQRRPSGYQIRMVWQRLCRQWSTSDGKLGASFTLGKWTQSGQNLRRRRQTYRDPNDESLIYHWISNSYWVYHRDPRSPRLYCQSHPSNWVPETICVPIDVISGTDATSLIVTFSPKLPLTHSLRFVANDFMDYISHLECWERKLLENVDMKYSPFMLLSLMSSESKTHQPFLAVSDGSVKGSSMTYAWVFGTASGTVVATNRGRGAGENTSHRAEAWGLLSISTFIRHLFLYTNSMYPEGNPPIVYISDNIGLITRIMHRMDLEVFPNRTLSPDWDVIEQTAQNFLSAPNIPREFQWIKGHQDELLDDLSVDAKYNILADSLADRAHEDSYSKVEDLLELPAALCQLFIGPAVVTSHYSKSIREAYALPEYLEYVSHRHGWPPDVRKLVDWQIFQQAISKTAPTMSQIQLVKFLHDKLPTNHERSKSDPHLSARCLYCTSQETFTHLLQCSNPISEKFRNQVHQEVEDYIQRFPWVPPSFKNAFMRQVQWSLGSVTHCPVTNPTHPQQTTLGPRALLKGFLHKHWRQSLEQSLRRNQDSNPDKAISLLSGVTALLWKLQVQLWNSHTKHQHGEVMGNKILPTSKGKYNQQRIRTLYDKRNQCLPGHRDMYFPTHLEEYLQTDTTMQMKQYLHSYEPAIQQSILQASISPQRSITSFPGFIRTTLRQIRDQVSRLSQPPSRMRNDGARGAPTHHKHTRWKQMQLESLLRSQHPTHNPPD